MADADVPMGGMDVPFWLAGVGVSVDVFVQHQVNKFTSVSFFVKNGGIKI